MKHHFAWRGEPIADIRAWASARHERMVRYHAERDVPSVLTGRIEHEEYDGEMPESFWHSLLMRDGWRYSERT
jgi:hypothetical protein